MIFGAVLIVLAIIIIVADALNMYREYKKQNLLGVVFWGIILICIMIAVT